MPSKADHLVFKRLVKEKHESESIIVIPPRVSSGFYWIDDRLVKRVDMLEE